MLNVVQVLAYICFAFLVSTTIAGLVLRYQHLHAKATADHDLNGIQKFHTTPVPRIGGVPIAVAILASWWLLAMLTRKPDVLGVQRNYCYLVISGSVAFCIGLLEDVTKKIVARTRLCVTFVAASLAWYWLDVKINRMDSSVIDAFLMTNSWASLLLTVFVVGGVSHAFNIIDGYNGLTSGVSVIVLSTLAIVASYLGDIVVAIPCWIMIGGIFGFLIFNFPYGKLFLGDGGAYLIGFMISVLSIQLTGRHPHEVSPWFPMLLVIYPVFETVFSMYRRSRQGRAIGLPDRGHLHQLIFLRLVRWKTQSSVCHDKTLRNSMTSPYLWGLTTMAVIPAGLFFGSTPLLVLFIVLFMVSYAWLYYRIVHFRTPRWMVLSIPDRK